MENKESQKAAHESFSTISFAPIVPIPDYLTGQVQSKLAYVDESILSAEVESDQIQLHLVPSRLTPEFQSLLEEKVQRVVESMAKGAFKPKVQVLEDYMDREVPYTQDPMPELYSRNEINQEDDGIYTLGPLLTKIIDYFESLFINLADSFEADPYRFPTLIPAKELA